MRRVIEGLLVLGVAGGALALALGYGKRWHPALDSFAHFRLHFAAAMALAALALAALRRRRRPLVLAALGVAAIIPHVAPGPQADGAVPGLRVVQHNMLFSNQRLDLAVGWLRAQAADVVALQEVRDRHWAALAALDDLYPHRHRCAFAHVGGVALLSRHPFVRLDCPHGPGVILGRIAPQGEPIDLVSYHAHWPWPFAQHRQIGWLVPTLAELDAGRRIVAGDFNAAPWSHAVERMAEASRTRVVPGLRMTIRVRGVPIPIDHVLLSPSLCATAARTGPRLGSDHHAVLVEVAWEGCPESR